MKQSLLFFFTFFLAWNIANAQKKDTLIIKNLTYSSDFESKYFKNVTDKKQFDKVAMLLALNPATTENDLTNANRALEQAFQNLDAAKINTKNLPKKVKAIFDLTHERFLKKYELVASFDQIMKDGTYNCVSATALYGLMLDHYNIPYEIKQLPTHVYLIADPSGSRVVLESTDPRGGYFEPDPKFKKSYVEYLQKSKLVSADEVRTKSVDELFTKNFQADKSINFQQLVALQYFNEGIKQEEVDSHSKALVAFQKSYRLYPANETRYLLTNSIGLQMQGMNYNKMEDIALLTSFYAMQPGDMYRDEFINDFKRLTQKYLLDKTDTVFYNKIYKEFITSSRDTISTNEIAYFYNFYTGRVNALRHQYDLALPYLRKAYRYNSSSAELTGLVRGIMQDEVSQNYRTLNFIKKLDTYGKDFPFLKEEPFYHKTYLLMYGQAVLDNFNANKREEGKKYLSLFEAKYKEHKTVILENNMVGDLFFAAARSYGDANNLTLAKQYARRGLAYDPTHSQLKLIANIPGK